MADRATDRRTMPAVPSTTRTRAGAAGSTDKVSTAGRQRLTPVCSAAGTQCSGSPRDTVSEAAQESTADDDFLLDEPPGQARLLVLDRLIGRPHPDAAGAQLAICALHWRLSQSSLPATAWAPQQDDAGLPLQWFTEPANLRTRGARRLRPARRRHVPSPAERRTTSRPLCCGPFDHGRDRPCGRPFPTTCTDTPSVWYSLSRTHHGWASGGLSTCPPYRLVVTIERYPMLRYAILCCLVLPCAVRC